MAYIQIPTNGGQMLTYYEIKKKQFNYECIFNTTSLLFLGLLFIDMLPNKILFGESVVTCTYGDFINFLELF